MPRRFTRSSTSTRLPGAAREAVPLLSVLATVAIAMAPVLRAGFFWDDQFYVVDNFAIRTLNATALRAIATEPLIGHYHPLTVLSFALDHALWGLRPFGYHLSNLVLHLVNVVLVYVFVRRLSGSRDAAWVGALLFGIHPLRVEPVAWVASRKDVLSTAFLLGAMLAYDRWLQPGRARSYAAALGLFVCAVLSKGSAVCLALVLPLLDWVRRRPLTRRSVLDKLPFLAIAVVMGLVAIWAATGGGSTASDTGQPLGARVLYPLYALAVYLGKTVWPTDLTTFYPFPALGAPYPVGAWLAPFVLTALGAFIAATARRTRTVAFGALYFLATIVLMVRPVGGALLAERYTYLPAVGLAYLAGEGYAWVRERSERRSRRLGAWVLAAVLLVSVGLGIATWRRATVWIDSRSLWNDILDKYPDADIAWLARGIERGRSGDTQGALSDIGEAIRIRPSRSDAYNSRADVRLEIGDLEGAAADYAQAARLEPDAAKPRYNLGYVRLLQGRPDAAIASFDEALGLEPRLVVAWFNRAEAKARLGRDADAVADYTAALEHDPGFAPALAGRAKAHARLGDRARAAEDARRASALGFRVP